MAETKGTGLEPFHQQLLELETEAKALCAELTPAQLAQRPPSGGWSIQQCLDHLNVTGERYLENLEPAVEAARARGERGQGRYHYGLLGGLFIRSQEPPVRFRMKSPQLFQPTVQVSSNATPNERVLPAFLELQERLRKLLTRADGLPLNGLKIASPESKWLKMSVFEAFGLLLAHERRHLWQAQGVKQQIKDTPAL